jgi:hypothetical protein
MSNKSNFTADEWKMLLSSPMLTSMAITLADPSGLWATMKEGMASGRAVLEAKNDPSASELAKAIAADMETSAGRSAARDGLKAELTGKTQVEIKQEIIATLSQVKQIVDTKAPGDAASFKGWLKHVAEKVAEASAEGGFLGLGGHPISDAEKASIGEIANTLGVT